jgi:mono/diheme cytochrome c family protein
MKFKSFLLIFSIVTLSYTSLLSNQDDEFAKSKERGKQTYEELCITCHLADGTGMEGVFPPLAGSDYLAKNKAGAIHAIKFGQEGEITVNGTVYNNVMPGQGLSDQEIADVMNYIQNSWGNKGKLVTAKEVESVKQ